MKQLPALHKLLEVMWGYKKLHTFENDLIANHNDSIFSWQAHYYHEIPELESKVRPLYRRICFTVFLPCFFSQFLDEKGLKSDRVKEGNDTG